MHGRKCLCQECLDEMDRELDEHLADDACDCEEYEYIDPLTGSATCNRCGSRRYLSAEQMKRIDAAQAEYDARMADEN